ncbi:hypothetical protein KUF54_00505 [Comamonas sp. Y33R10-2]|uniref:hypothetical protein n=1 Tax=Comamonas sp. Y33R10-2 TaxID=2853257 RepID=UPI001C5C8D8C|nr:hypothetical protein [Comamonas sp. Y33R10-2]QXZ09796.1 hypothetical protein KUF54_00505 [Comamonas sp. Y33R10-2]
MDHDLSFDPAFVQSLHDIAWFSRCGEALAEGLPFDARQVVSQKHAYRQCASTQWESVTLEARNALTGFLAVKARDEYQQWNILTRQARERIITPLKEQHWEPFAQKAGLGSEFMHCVQWDLFALCMEHAYRHQPALPQFFHGLRKVYGAGHFPCGWEGGKYPAGRLQVW